MRATPRDPSGIRDWKRGGRVGWVLGCFLGWAVVAEAVRGQTEGVRPLPPVEHLLDEDPVVAEKARRRWALADPDALPAAELLELFQRGGDGGGPLRGDAARRIAGLLADHGLGAEVLEAAAARSDLDDDERLWLAAHADAATLRRWLAPVVEPGATGADAMPPDVALAALYALNDRFGGDPTTQTTLVAALLHGDDDVREGVGRLLVYEWADLPGGLLAAVAEAPAARRSLLATLARKPRPETGPTLERWLAGGPGAPELSVAERLSVLAGVPPASMTAAHAREVLRAHVAELPAEAVDAAWRAAAQLPPRLVDGLVGEFQRLVLQGAEASHLLPCLRRISEAGAEQLLGVAPTLPARATEAVLTAVADHDSGFLVRRTIAALDGEVPIEEWMLRRAADLLRAEPGDPTSAERPQRVERLVAELQARDGERAMLAFSALVDAQVFRPAMVRFATDDRLGLDERWARLARLVSIPGAPLDVRLVVELVESGDRRAMDAGLRAFVHRPLPADLEAVFLERARTGDPSADAATAMRAICRQGRELAVRALWDQLAGAPRYQLQLILVMLEEPRPWTQPLFLTELLAREREAGKPVPAASGAEPAAGGADPSAGDVTALLRLGLAKLGDRHLVDELVAEAPQRSSWFLQRATGFVVPQLQQRHVDALGTALLTDPELAEGAVAHVLVGWLAERPAEAAAVLETLWREREDEALRQEALRGLLAGPSRDRLLAGFVARLFSEPMRGEVRDLAYSVLGALPFPLSAEDTELVAQLILVGPLGDVDRTLARSQRIRTGRVGFPFLSAAVHTLCRGEPPNCRDALQKAAAAARAHPDFSLASGVALTNLMLLGAQEPEVMDAIHDVVAPLLLELPEPDAPGRGLAHWIVGLQLEAAGRYETAIPHFEAALRLLARDPSLWWTVRVAFGERDGGGGAQPLAALAARPWICRFHIARAGGDARAAARQLEVARRMAAGDDATVAELVTLAEEAK